LLLGERLPHPVRVGVVPEAGDQPGAQAEPCGGGGEVRDTARARPHALGPQLLTGLGHAIHAGEDDVEEDGAGQEHVQRRVLGRAQRRQGVPVLALGGQRRGWGRSPRRGGLGLVVIGHHLATPSSIPRMKWRWRKRNRITVGRATMTAPAASRAVSEVYWPWKVASPSGAVRSRPPGAMTRAMRNSFQVHMNTSTSM